MTKDIHLKVDEQCLICYLFDSIYRLYVFFPAREISPFLDRAGFEELDSWTITV
jgi:hypothetical protein